MHHSSWQACPLSSGKSGENTVNLGDLGVQIPVVLCAVMLGHGYRCSFIEAWSYWVVTFRSFFHSIWPLTRVWSGSVVKPPGCAKQLLVERGVTKSQKKRNGSSTVYFCQRPVLQSPTAPYARASATDVMMLWLMCCLPNYNRGDSFKKKKKRKIKITVSPRFHWTTSMIGFWNYHWI